MGHTLGFEIYIYVYTCIIKALYREKWRTTCWDLKYTYDNQWESELGWYLPEYRGREKDEDLSKGWEVLDVQMKDKERSHVPPRLDACLREEGKKWVHHRFSCYSLGFFHRPPLHIVIGSLHIFQPLPEYFGCVIRVVVGGGPAREEAQSSSVSPSTGRGRNPKGLRLSERRMASSNNGACENDSVTSTLNDTFLKTKVLLQITQCH